MGAPSSGEPPNLRIGVFGGTFDPPHVGHLVAAIEARFQLGLDRVLMVVANHPWQKEGRRPVTAAAHRLAMVERAAAGVPGLEASSIEIDRGGTTFTADTLAELDGLHPGAALYLVLGADAARGLPTWERVEEVRARAELVVVDRLGEASAAPSGWPCHRVVMPRLDISSTELRRRLAHDGPVDFLVPGEVVRYAREHALYAGGE